MTIIIFLISIGFAILAKYVELQMGIGNDYHPDSIYYINSEVNLTDIFGRNDLIDVFSGLVTAFFPLFVKFTTQGFGISGFLVINILIYALTNCIAYKTCKASSCKQGLFLFTLFFLEPYRLHLAIHVLKETQIIFLLLLVTTLKFKWKFLLVGMGTLFRPIFASYLYPFFNHKISLVLFLTFIIMSVFYSPLNNFLMHRAEVDMGGRDLLTLPFEIDFSDPKNIYELLLKSVLWSLSAVFGFFALFTAGPIFMLLGFEQFFQKFLILTLRINSVMLISIILFGIILASGLSSFGAFYRYFYPVLALFPVWVAIKNE